VSAPRLHSLARWLLRAVGLALTLQLASCHFAGTNTHNLDELHWSDGRHKRTGTLWTNYEYAVHVGLRGLVSGLGGKPQEEAATKIDDPLKDCVNNLAELVDYSDSDPEIVAQKVEYCSRLAVDDSWNLTREIAVRELGRQGARLQLAQHPPRKPVGEPASVDMVREALRRLINACGPVLKGGAVSAEQSAEFAASCDAIDALDLDRQGALRMLRSVTIIESARGDNPRLAPLHALSLDLQRTCVRMALDAAVNDAPPSIAGGTNPGWNNPRVRGAAIEAFVMAYGEPAYLHFLSELSPRDADAEHLLALLRLVKARGFPQPPPDAKPEDRERAERQWSETMMRLATEYPEAPVRIAAMGALAKIGGRASYSLREEDWQTWWAQRAAAANGNKGP
jgi:hypothetical protein